MDHCTKAKIQCSLGKWTSSQYATIMTKAEQQKSPEVCLITDTFPLVLFRGTNEGLQEVCRKLQMHLLPVCDVSARPCCFLWRSCLWWCLLTQDCICDVCWIRSPISIHRWNSGNGVNKQHNRNHKSIEKEAVMKFKKKILPSDRRVRFQTVRKSTPASDHVWI